MMNHVLQALFACHRLPERSFFFRGKQFPLCSRCTGILIGYIIGILYFIFFDKINFFLALSLIIPLVIDGYGQYLGKWISNNGRRFFTGVLAGVGTVYIIYWIAVYGFTHGRDIARLLING